MSVLKLVIRHAPLLLPLRGGLANAREKKNIKMPINI